MSCQLRRRSTKLNEARPETWQPETRRDARSPRRSTPVGRRACARRAEARDWLRVERLPAYAPELNPVEGLWGTVKGTELANRCPDTIDDVMQAARTGLHRVRSDADLCFALLRRTGLTL